MQVDWAYAGGSGGCTLVGNGYSATFTAGDEATGAAIVATLTDSVAAPTFTIASSTTLTIVRPSNVTAEKVGDGTGHLGLPPAPYGFTFTAACIILNWHFYPDDVSFSMIEYQELEAPKEDVKGWYRERGDSHPQENWKGIIDINNGAANDVVGNSAGTNYLVQLTNGTERWSWGGFDTTNNPPVFELGGEMTWNIPWIWRKVSGGNRTGFLGGTNPHKVKINAENGKMKIIKLEKEIEDGPFTGQ